MPRSLFVTLAAIVTLVGISAVVLLGLAARRLESRRFLVGLLLAAYGMVILIRPEPWWIIDAAVLGAGLAGALMIERGLSTPAAVSAFLVVAATIDVISVFRGPSRALVDAYRSGSNKLLLYLTLVLPIRERVVPIVGIGDLFVAGAAGVALIRLGYRVTTVLGALAFAMMVALAYGLWRGGTPALPFVAVVIVALVGWKRPDRVPVDAMSGP